MNDTRIHVLVASDDAYFKGLAATIASLVRHCSRPDDLVVHVLDGGITTEHRASLRDIAASRQSSVAFHPFDQAQFDDLAPWHGTGKMAYARLLAPEILPDVRHVIYCDVDVLWHADAARLWALRSDDCSLQYVANSPHEPHSDATEDQWLREHRLSLDRGNYFCSGLLVMNLAKFRAESLHKRTLDLLGETGGKATYADQTVLNVVFSRRSDTGELPAEWQVTSRDREALAKAAYRGGGMSCILRATVRGGRCGRRTTC